MTGTSNPFPGPRPYTRKERKLFFGREDVLVRIVDRVLGIPCLVVHGPSGAGKSSVIQAALIPLLETEALPFRVVGIDRWPDQEDPLGIIVEAMYEALGLGDPPAKPGRGALVDAMELAWAASERPVFLHLDQIEQLFYPGRPDSESALLFEALERLVRLPRRGVSVVLTIREDYLGLFRDRMRNRRALLEHGFRVGPLVVSEMVSAVRSAAAYGGREWDEEKTRGLILQMRERAPSADAEKRARKDEDRDEVKAAYVQIVCRALWESRGDRMDAKQIVEEYLTETLSNLGDAAHRVRALLEDELIDAAGHRTLITSSQAQETLGEAHADELLGKLEAAAILRGEEHRNERRYELGHDWLAKKVRDLREERLAKEEKERLEKEEKERLEKERAKRRVAYGVAGIALVVMGVMAGLAWWANQQKNLARERSIMAGVRENLAAHETHHAALLLLEVEDQERARGWVELAGKVLDERMPWRTIARPWFFQGFAELSPDGTRILQAYPGGVRVERVFGEVGPWELKPGKRLSVQSAAWSPDGKHVALATGSSCRGHLWSLTGALHELAPVQGTGVAMQRHCSFAWSPDGRRLVAWSREGVEVWDADRIKLLESLLRDRNDSGFYWAGFVGDEVWALTQDASGVLSLRQIGNSRDRVVLGESSSLSRGEATTVYAGFEEWRVKMSADGAWILTRAETDTTPYREEQLWRADGLLEPISPAQVDNWQRFSPDGKYILGIDAADVVLWDVDLGKTTRRLHAHSDLQIPVMSPHGRWIAAASSSGKVALWRSDEGSTDRGRADNETGGEPPALELNVRFDWRHTPSFSSDDRAILFIGEKRLEVWDVEVEGEPVTFESKNSVAADFIWRADSTPLIAVANGDEISIRNGEGTAEPVTLRGFKGPFSHMKFSKDGTRIALHSFPDVWIWGTDAPATPMHIASDCIDRSKSDWVALDDALEHVAFVCGDKGFIRRTDGMGPDIPLESLGEAKFRHLDFSPDGRRLAVNSFRNNLLVFRTDRPEPPIQPALREVAFEPPASWGPDGMHLVAKMQIEGDRGVLGPHVFSVDGSSDPILLRGNQASANTASWSHDGRLIALISINGRVQINRADGNGSAVILNPRVDAHNVEPDSLLSSGSAIAAFSPDDQWVAVVTGTSPIRIWRVDDSETLFTLHGSALGKKVHRIAFSPDGTKLGVAYNDGSVRFWTVSIPALRSRLRAATSDCLPPNIRSLYLDEPQSTAEERYRACETSHGRIPFESQPVAIPSTAGSR